MATEDDVRSLSIGLRGLEGGFWASLCSSSKATCRPSFRRVLSVSQWEGEESGSLAIKDLLPWSPFMLPVSRDTGLLQRSKELFPSRGKERSVLGVQLPDRVSALGDATSPPSLRHKTEVRAPFCTAAN